ncbi:MAG: hypothetical protein AB9836_04540 [Aminipila sp.]
MKKSIAEEIEDAKKQAKCYRCGDILINQGKDKNTVSSYSQRYKISGHVPFCRNCLFELFKQFVDIFNSNYSVAIFHLCQICDWPYNRWLENKKYESSEECFDEFLRSFNLEKKSEKSKGFIGGQVVYESDLFVNPVENALIIGNSESQEQYDEESETANAWRLFVKWGRNPKYKLDDYEDLEKTFTDICGAKGNLIDDSTSKNVIIASKAFLEYTKCTNDGNSEEAKRWNDIYDKALGAAQLRMKDTNVGNTREPLVQDIVQHCEADDFVEPWDKIIKYPHQMDLVDQIILNIANYLHALLNLPKLNKLPDELKVIDYLGELSDVETDLDRHLKQALIDIADFKAGTFGDSDDDSTDDPKLEF